MSSTEPLTTTDRAPERHGTTDKLAYSVTEVAHLLSISRASAYAYVRSGEIRSVSLGGRIIVPRTAIDELLEGGA